jgi:TolA-binding protein
MKKRSVMRWTLPFASILFCTAALAAIPTKPMQQFPEGEKLVYQRLIDAYHHNNLNDVEKARQTLERNYPSSIYLDSAYYFSGMTEVQHNHYGEALKDFDVVQQKYAKGKKRPSALFAIGAVYQKLNLPVQAYRVFQRLQKDYPGSPESMRAWMQLRVSKSGLNNMKKKTLTR